jgi:hypothetical protein
MIFLNIILLGRPGDTFAYFQPVFFYIDVLFLLFVLHVYTILQAEILKMLVKWHAQFNF